MNSNSNSLFNSSFSPKPSIFPQTSTFFSTMIQNPYPTSPSLKVSHPRLNEPIPHANISNSDFAPSTTNRCLNFENTNFVFECPQPKNPTFFSIFGKMNSNHNNNDNMSQTPNYMLGKQKEDPQRTMEVEVSNFSPDALKIRQPMEEIGNISLQNLVQNIDIPAKGISTSETKASTEERYPQPKRRNPTIMKRWRNNDKVFHGKFSTGATPKLSKEEEHKAMPAPLTHFTRSNSDVPPTLESNLGFAALKDEPLGDNKYLNNLKGAPKSSLIKPAEDKILGGNHLFKSNFDLFNSSHEKSGSGHKARFAKNLFDEFNNDAVINGGGGCDSGLFQIPEKNCEYDFVDFRNGQKLDFDNQDGFEEEHTTTENTMSKFLDLEEPSVTEQVKFDIFENHNTEMMGGEQFTPKKDVDFETPTKDSTADFDFMGKSAGKFNLFSTITAKKEYRANIFNTELTHSTNVTEPSIGDFLSTRKGEFTTSSHKEHRGRTKLSGAFSRFEHDYDVIENLGTGDHGTVYKCQNKLDGLIYAIKCTNSKLKIENSQNNHVLHEAHALAALSALDENPYIVRYYNAWIEDEKLYLVMEHCQNNIRIIRSEKGRFSESTIRQIMRDICMGLKHLHSQRIVHLAIKPENILYSKTKKYKIADLGLSKIVKSSPEENVSEGDCRYQAPELLRTGNEIPDLTKADIFSLGVTIYELMTGSELTRNGQDWRDIRRGNLNKLDHTPYSNSLKSIVQSMTSPDPETRPSAVELLGTFLQSEIECELKREKQQNQRLKKQIKELEGQLGIRRKNSM